LSQLQQSKSNLILRKITAELKTELQRVVLLVTDMQ